MPGYMAPHRKSGQETTSQDSSGGFHEALLLRSWKIAICKV